MKTVIGTVIILGVGAVIAALLALDAATKLDLISSTFDSYQDAQAGKTWVPSYIPVTAREIVEVHNVDTNDCCARFRLPAAGLELFTASLQQRAYAPTSAAASPPWYFASYSKPCPFGEEEAGSARLVLRSVSPEPAAGKTQYFAIAEEKEMVYYWTADH